MNTYSFSADRQLIFYVNVEGQQRLVRFGERNAFGSSVFQTSLKKTADAIRRSSLYKRGVIKEQVTGETASSQPVKPKASGMPGVLSEEVASGGVQDDRTFTSDAESGDVIEAKNFTQAKSLLAKRLGISYSSIKNPEHLQKLAKDAGVTVVY